MDHFASPRRMRGDILFGPFFTLGILAAIAIPAYFDYTIRSQVAEGLNLASAVKAGVAESYAATGAWPADLKQAGLTGAPRGRYVTSVTVRNGTVVILYGGQANAWIARHQLTLRPSTTERGDVVWSCGHSPDVGVDPRKGAAAPHATDIPLKYLPRACRG